MDKTKQFIWLKDNELRINLNKLASEGINVWLEDEKLKFKGEQGKVTEEALKWMRQNKTAIISYLLEKEEVQDKGFDLTPIQKAYFLGRDNLYELGGISANYYFEIDMDKLDVPHCKIPVFEHGQNTEVYEEGGSCNPLLVSFETCLYCFFLFWR